MRVAEADRRTVNLLIDGRAVQALAGDTVMVAMLATMDHLRTSEFGDGRRAGFCLMGACQDCWVWTGAGHRLRACSTTVEEGMQLCTRPPEDLWSNLP